MERQIYSRHIAIYESEGGRGEGGGEVKVEEEKEEEK